MATIANDTQFIGISPTIDLTGKKSAILNEQTIPVTMEDITSTVRPYKVFTALLTQSGGDFLDQLDEDTPTQNVTKGTTYTISNASDGDFTNVGAPNNNDGTSFIAINNEVPNSWGEGGAALIYNTGAPVAIVLENTIGNVWFTYQTVGAYIVNSNGLFTYPKTFVIAGSLMETSVEDFSGSVIFNSSGDSACILLTFDSSNVLINGQLVLNPIEIRVYE